MIRFNIIGHGFLDVAETGGIAFKTQNQHFRFCDISLGRSVEFSVPATDHNRQMLDFGEDAAETGEMLRRVYPCQLVYDGGAKMGTIMVTGYAGEAFSCVFTIGNAEWLQAIQERKLSDCVVNDKGVTWADNQTPVDANAADPTNNVAALVRYENGFAGSHWQLLPSVNVKQYLIDLFTNLGIPFSSSIDSKYWMVAGSLKGGGMDSVTLTQTDNTSFSLSQTQTYFSIEDITIEWATANLFGALVGGGTAASKAYKVGADIKITFPYSLTAHNYLIRWNAKLKRCEVLGTTNTGSTIYKDLNGATLDLEKGDIIFFASKPLIDATTYYGWKAGDISAITVAATVERNADLQLGEVWYLRNNQPDMTVFEFLKSVALAAGLELTVDGETGVTMTAGAYGTNTMKALERVIAAESVTRRVESWGSGTQKAVVKFDSEEYVTEPINADFVIDNDQFDEVSEHVSKFSEGNVGTNGILIEDVEAGPKFKAKKWTIAFVDTNSTYLQRVQTPDPVGYDDLSMNSTCLRAKIAAPLAEFFDLTPSTVYVWRGCAYLWSDADWSDGVLGLTLQRVSQPQTSVSPTPPPPEPVLTGISVTVDPDIPTIYDDMTLNDLKQYLTVVATYDNSVQRTLNANEYTLSGSMTAGTQTITVTYQGETATFTITVVAVELTRIKADFVQGAATIYDTDSLDDLKPYLTVTAVYNNGSEVVLSDNDYTLSGSLVAPSSTITVGYGGQSDTFTVAVTHQQSLPYDAQVEYIENTGSSYIIPNITGNGRIVITAQANYQKGSSQVLVTTTQMADAGTYFGEAVSTKKWGFGASAGMYANIVVTQKITADITFDSNGASGNVDGNNIARSVSVTQGDWRIFISQHLNRYPFAGKIFSAQIYQNDVLVRDFIPVRVGQTGYLYDKVSGTLFGNEGTGSFAIGNDVSV